MTGRYASVAAVGRGGRILEILSRHPDGLSLTEIAVPLEPHSDIHATAHHRRRLATALAEDPARAPANEES